MAGDLSEDRPLDWNAFFGACANLAVGSYPGLLVRRLNDALLKVTAKSVEINFGHVGPPFHQEDDRVIVALQRPLKIVGSITWGGSSRLRSRPWSGPTDPERQTSLPSGSLVPLARGRPPRTGDRWQ